MEICLAQDSEAKKLTQLSKAAFDSDINVGGSSVGGPPEYDNEEWHKQMAAENHLYSVYVKGQLIGGALLFLDNTSPHTMYLGRIFIDPLLHRHGYGIEMMNMIESMFPDIKCWKLDTPCWNVRTNRFYQKLGYHEANRDKYFIYYEKNISDDKEIGS